MEAKVPRKASELDLRATVAQAGLMSKASQLGALRQRFNQDMLLRLYFLAVPAPTSTSSLNTNATMTLLLRA